MSLDFKQLGPLFTLSRDAVLGLENDRVVFLNPVAERWLNLEEGASVKELLPPELLESGDGRYVSTLSLPDGPANLSLLRDGARALLTLCRRDAAPYVHPPGSQRVFADSLATLRMALDALLSHTEEEPDPQRRRYIAIVYRQYYSLQRLCSHLSLTENIRSGSQPLALRSVDLAELFGELCRSTELLAGEFKDTSIRFRAEPGLYITAADPELMELMFLNLLANSLLHRRGGHIQAALRVQGERFILSLDDDGSGIDSETLPQLFSGAPDLKSAHNGAGLGLGIARGIAELHGGTLILESRPGEGSSVRIVLPKTNSDHLSLHMPHPRYGSDGLHCLLTELAPLLPDEAFGPVFSD